MEAYLPIGMLLIIAIVMCAGIFATSFLGPNNPLGVKLSPYECGVAPEGNARTPFKSRFYLIAVLFLLFDVEAVFIFPWALVYKDSIGTGPALLIAMLFYLFFVMLALFYVLRKKVLELN